MARIERLAGLGRRAILGIVGCPGSGKSTVTQAIVDVCEARGVKAVWLPMDGFHLADIELSRLGRLSRKGAIDTFDGAGFVNLLSRIRAETGRIVYAPTFDRTIEEPVAGSIPIEPDAQLIITEGNYLLDDSAPWVEARPLLDELWFIDTPDDERIERLIRRHVDFGKPEDEAGDWVRDVDEVNARRVKASARNATRVVSADEVNDLVEGATRRS